MKIIQTFYDYTKRMIQRGSVPTTIMGVALLLLTIAVVHQTSRLHHLETGASEAKMLLSKRSTLSKVILSKTDVAPGAIYTRWGRTTCPEKLSKLVYHGVTAGQYYGHTGGASNILCLPLDPSWDNFTAKSDEQAIIYGAEYEVNVYHTVHPSGLFSDANSKTLHDHNVPCAVCQTLEPATVMMLPARKTCHDGWTLEYFGYLMSDHHTHKGRSQYTCVDVAPEADPAGYRNENGVLFYFVEGSCGSLPCPPYVQGKELTCAVCSQRQRQQRHTFKFDNETKELIGLL